VQAMPGDGMSPRERRIHDLRTLRKRIDDELVVLESALPTSRHTSVTDTSESSTANPAGKRTPSTSAWPRRDAAWRRRELSTEAPERVGHEVHNENEAARCGNTCGL
jgi:hypothetical protein